MFNMKTSNVRIYESPKKAYICYIDSISTEIEAPKKWKFCRTATVTDMKRLKKDQKDELKKNGYVIIVSIKVIIKEESSPPTSNY
jgi:hypothetical protein